MALVREEFSEKVCEGDLEGYFKRDLEGDLSNWEGSLTGTKGETETL